MKNKSKKGLTKNMSIEEASEFWDQHDIFEFGEVKEVDVEFQLSKKHYVGINEELYAKIESYAKKNNQEPDSLIQNWISEKTNELD